MGMVMDLEEIEPVDEAIQDLIMAIVRLQNLTDKNFVIIQLQDLLEEMTRSES
jgi:hypothetical protein